MKRHLVEEWKIYFFIEKAIPHMQENAVVWKQLTLIRACALNVTVSNAREGTSAEV